MFRIRDADDAFAAGYLISRLQDLCSKSKIVRNYGHKWITRTDKEALSFEWTCDIMDSPSGPFREALLQMSTEQLREAIEAFILEKNKEIDNAS